MRFGIDKKVISLFILSVAILGIALGIYFVRHEEQALLLELDERAKALLGSLSISSEYPVLIKNRELLSKVAGGVFDQKDVIFCQIKDSQGEVLFEGGRRGEEDVREYAGSILTERLEREALILEPEEKKIEEIGKIHLGLSLGSMKEKLREAQKTIGLIVVLSTLFASLIITLLIRQLLGEPIKQLVLGTEMVAKGNLNYEVPVKTKDEIGELAASFNKMAKDLQISSAELEESERQYRLLAENVTDVIWTTDMDLHYTYVSPSVASLRGYSVKETMAQGLGEVLTPASYKAVMEAIKEEMAIGQKDLPRSRTMELMELEEICKDGSRIRVEVKMTFLRDKDNRAVGILGVTRDITEKKRMAEELQKAQQIESIGLLAGGVAHDFNNILSAILLNTQIAKRQKEKDIQKYLDGIEKATYRATNLTHQLLTFSRGGAPIKGVVSISNLLKETAEFALTGSNARCKFSIPDDIFSTEVDKAQISQVINNLVINASQAMPEGGIIEIKVENLILGKGHSLPLKEGKYIKISIKDSGIGIPKEDLPKVFNPYFTTKQRGSGLGLTTAYSIIKRHNGYINLESDLGVGTTFYIYLPACEKLPIEEGERGLLIKGEGRILLMDDEQEILDSAGNVLRELGYQVEMARDGDEAIRLYQRAKEPFDLVIVDLTIPAGIGGKEVINRLKEIDPSVKAIVASGYSNDPIIADFKRYGFCGALLKPYNIEELSRVLHKVLK